MPYDWKGEHKKAVKSKGCNGCEHIKTMPCWNGLSDYTDYDITGTCPEGRAFKPISLKDFIKVWDSFWSR